MAAGGMYDQIGGGFHRYSVDAYWLVPHFEKMLYDQALLTRAYTQAWLVTGEPRYRRIVEETIDYVLRDLRHPDDGFFSAEDADSEGIEGKFYLWSLEEIDEVLGDDAPEVIRYFGVTARGNFEDPHTRYRGNILHVVDREEEPSPTVLHCRHRLYDRRSGRVRPGLDDKVLLGWNALFLHALAEAAAAFGRRRLDGRGARQRALPPHARCGAPTAGCCGRGRTAAPRSSRTPRTTPRCSKRCSRWPRSTTSLGSSTRGPSPTSSSGSSPTTSAAGSSPPAPTPKRSSCARRTTRTTRRRRRTHSRRRGSCASPRSPATTCTRTVATRWVGALAPVVGEHPSAFAYLLGAVERVTLAPLEVVIVGDPDDPMTAALIAEVHGRVLPASVHVVASPGTDDTLTPLLAGRTAVARPTAYVCRHFVCDLPVTDPESLRAQLDTALHR